MKPRNRWRLGLVAAALALVALMAFGRTERAEALVCAQAQEQIASFTGVPVVVGRCVFEPLLLQLRLEDFVVGASAPVVLRAGEVRVSLGGVLWGGVELGEVRVSRPELSVVLPAVSAAGKHPECPLDALRRLRVRRLELEEGRVEVRDADGRSLALEGIEVRASLDRHRALVEVEARGGAVRPSADRALVLGRARLDGELDLDGRQVELDELELNLEGLRASVRGRVESLCDDVPRLALAGQLFVPLRSLARLVPSLPPSDGQLWSRAQVSGRVDAPVLRVELQASQVSVGPYLPGDFSARLGLAQDVLRIDELVTPVGDGTLKLSGKVHLKGDFPLDVAIESSGASFARAMERAGVKGSWVEFPASVRASLSGRLRPSPELSGPVAFDAGRFSLAARPWSAPRAAGRALLGFESARGTFTFALDREAVAFLGAKLSAGASARTQATASVRLFYDSSRGMEVDATAESVDLADFGSIAELPWEGIGSGSVSIRGPYHALDIRGTAAMRDFRFADYSLGVVQAPLRYSGETLSFPSIVGQKGKTQYFGDLALVFRDEGLWTRASAKVPDGRVEDLVDLLAGLSPTLENLQGTLTGRLSAAGAVDCPAAELTGDVAVRLADVRLFDRGVGEASGTLRFEGGDALVLEPVAFEGPLGRVSAAGRWDFEGPLSFAVEASGGELGALVDPAGALRPRSEGGYGLEVGGAFDAQVRVGGTTDLVRVDATLAAPEVRVRGEPAGPARLELREIGRDIVAEGQLFSGVRGRFVLGARGDWPFEAGVSFDLPDLGALLPSALRELRVGARGTLSALGPLRSLGDVRLAASVDRLAVARGDLRLANDGPVELAYRQRRLEVQSLTLRGSGSELVVRGSFGPTVADLRARGAMDLALLSSALPKLDRASGHLDFSAALSGPTASPVLAGSAELRGAQLQWRGDEPWQEVSVRDLVGRAEFSETRVLVSDVRGEVNGGRVDARGELLLERLAPRAASLQLDLEGLVLQLSPELPATLRGALALGYQPGRSLLSGSLEVQRLVYDRPLVLESFLTSLRRGSAREAERPEEWLWFDVDLTAGDDVRIENNLARAKLQGSLELTGSNVRPSLSGSIEAQTGAQAFFRGNTYSVSRGLVQFSGPSQTFDLAAQTQVREYVVAVRGFGRLDEPQVRLTSEPSLSEADIVSLLTVGVTTREALRAQSGIGLAGEALLSASGLDREVQRFLQDNVGLRDQQFRLTTTFNEATGTAEPAVTWESKILEDLKVGVTQPVTGKGTKAQAELRHSPRVSTRAQWDNQNQTSTLGNPGVELRLHFEWE